MSEFKDLILELDECLTRAGLKVTIDASKRDPNLSIADQARMAGIVVLDADGEIVENPTDEQILDQLDKIPGTQELVVHLNDEPPAVFRAPVPMEELSEASERARDLSNQYHPILWERE